MRDERVCVAGYPLSLVERTSCVRPDFHYGAITESWLLSHGTAVVRPFAVVELDLLHHRPEPPHTEDWIIDRRCRGAHGITPIQAQHALLNDLDDSSVAEIFGAEVHHDRGWWVKSGTGYRSLGTIRPTKIVGLVYAPRQNRDT